MTCDTARRGGTTSDLSFSAYSTVNINLFANLADRFGGAKAPNWLKGSRLSIGINNVFDRRYAGSVIVGDTNGRFFEPAPGRNWFIGASIDVAI